LEAMLYEKAGDAVNCLLCARRCIIAEGKLGACGVRENKGGTLRTLVYGKVASCAVDPIEKKPLYHFHPGTNAFSISTVGCNFRCRFCDNWSISQPERISGEPLSPCEIVSMAKRSGCRSISYTYTEPTIFFEYAYDTARLAKKEGIFNTFVTNGYMTPEAVEAISPYLDAATVDFKGSGDPLFYRTFCGAPDSTPVFEALLEMKRRRIFIEVTNLIVPGGGDLKPPFLKLADWIRDELGAETPYHLLRFFPSYLCSDASQMPPKRMEEFWSIARGEGLRHVYLGNMPGGDFENTICPSCGSVAIERCGFEVLSTNLNGNACSRCGRALNIVV